ncbi:putative argininosuccinate synthase [Rosellinia necatrix]|uniref:Putative argininosuccinate synthase n=1 Tax=Rosellinia necatrix TaxID=77044 RepID=A0A1S7UJ25_ROSNE|nr:putative argininosuccinate synthase [Rosellinia necatrix]
MTAPDKPTPFTVHFAEGVPVKLEVEVKAATGSFEIFKEANEIRVMFVGLKSRGCYNTPGLTILRLAHPRYLTNLNMLTPHPRLAEDLRYWPCRVAIAFK